MIDLSQFPSGERVSSGFDDLARERHTANALLVAMASARLSSLGFFVPVSASTSDEPELALYALLCETEDDPFYTYKSLRQGLDSFLASYEALLPRR